MSFEFFRYLETVEDDVLFFVAGFVFSTATFETT
jgi:hypothetical protein